LNNVLKLEMHGEGTGQLLVRR